MFTVTDEKFNELINQALSSLPASHLKRLENVAILYEYDPTPDQRQALKLQNNQTLFGLYEGVPLSKRQGMVKLLPDKITIFKNPISAYANSEAELKKQIRHTLWHEIAHFYGLGHSEIRQLEA